MSNAARRSAPGHTSGDRGGRLSAGYLCWLAERLSERDWAIIESVNRLRLVSGDQLQRLYFFELAGRSGEVMRGRVLHRLVGWRVLDILPRRIGGAARGSAGSIFALGLAGQRLLAQRQAAACQTRRVRQAGVPTDRLLAHTLAVSELYVGLVEATRRRATTIAAFDTEPASWWPDGLGGQLKPDAYARLERGKVRDHWWIEADRATESLPTLRRQLNAYLSFAERGQLGPGDVVPRVIVSCVTPARRNAVETVARNLPAPAEQLFGITSERETVPYMLSAIEI